MEPYTTKALGVEFNSEDDTFTFSIPKGFLDNREDDKTKKEVLSIQSRHYDPLGFVCPAVLEASIHIHPPYTHAARHT